MQRIARAVVAILLLLSMSGAARSEESAKIAVGLKTWVNSWKSEEPGSESMKSNSIALVGWAAEAEFSNRVFVEASYLVSVSDYEFDQTVVTTERERNDFDAAIGYQFSHNMGYFVGYRSSQFLERATKSKETVSGPFVGVRGTAPLLGAVSLFGKLTYLPLSNKATFTTTTQRETSTGWFAEAGIKYYFTGRVSGTIGYQYETSQGENTKIRDTFAGPTLGVMYSF